MLIEFQDLVEQQYVKSLEFKKLFSVNVCSSPSLFSPKEILSRKKIKFEESTNT